MKHIYLLLMLSTLILTLTCTAPERSERPYTTYVVGDILYLDGTHYWNQQRTIDLYFETKEQAKMYHELTTLNVVNATLDVLDSLKTKAEERSVIGAD